MGIVATIVFSSKKGKERILFNITKAFKAIILWIVRIFPEANSREPVSWSSEEISVSRGNFLGKMRSARRAKHRE